MVYVMDVIGDIGVDVYVVVVDTFDLFLFVPELMWSMLSDLCPAA